MNLVITHTSFVNLPTDILSLKPVLCKGLCFFHRKMKCVQRCEAIPSAGHSKTLKDLDLFLPLYIFLNCVHFYLYFVIVFDVSSLGHKDVEGERQSSEPASIQPIQPPAHIVTSKFDFLRCRRIYLFIP